LLIYGFQNNKKPRKFGGKSESIKNFAVHQSTLSQNERGLSNEYNIKECVNDIIMVIGDTLLYLPIGVL
jgi:hypothetical protein